MQIGTGHDHHNNIMLVLISKMKTLYNSNYIHEFSLMNSFAYLLFLTNTRWAFSEIFMLLLSRNHIGRLTYAQVQFQTRIDVIVCLVLNPKPWVNKNARRALSVRFAAKNEIVCLLQPYRHCRRRTNRKPKTESFFKYISIRGCRRRDSCGPCTLVQVSVTWCTRILNVTPRRHRFGKRTWKTHSRPPDGVDRFS